MRTLIILVVGLLSVGCGKAEPMGSGNEYNTGLPADQNTTKPESVKELTPESILGTYKRKDVGTSREKLLIFRIDNVLDYNYLSDTVSIGKWNVINGEAVVTFRKNIRDVSESTGGYYHYYKVDYYRMEKNGDLTMVANGKKTVKDGRIERQDLGEENFYNYMKQAN